MRPLLIKKEGSEEEEWEKGGREEEAAEGEEEEAGEDLGEWEVTFPSTQSVEDLGRKFLELQVKTETVPA